MAIIVQRENERVQVIQQAGFPVEVDLQRYVCENPQVLPIGEIKEGAQFTVLDRETPVASGSVDILGVEAMEISTSWRPSYSRTQTSARSSPKYWITGLRSGARTKIQRASFGCSTGASRHGGRA